MLSIIIPSLNEEQNIQNTFNRISEICTESSIDHEFWFIDDGSNDKTWSIISKLFIHSNVFGIRFSRCFGKEAAIFAGLKNCNGDCCVVIDCDLQHPPEKIPEMYKHWKNGYEVVNAIKITSHSNKIHKGFSSIFNSIMELFSGVNLKNASDFKLLDRKLMNVLINLPESKTFFRALVPWTGYKSYDIYFNVAERQYGKSKWSAFKLVKYAITNIASFSSLPLQIITWLGLIFFVFAIILSVQTLINWLSGKVLGGFTTVILLQLIIGSCIMIGLGIIGYYISLIFTEAKERPRYIVADKFDGKKENIIC